MPTYTGPAYYTDTENFQKISFGDVESSPFTLDSNNGWIGIIQRYFASSWILTSKENREFFSKEITSNIYASGLKTGLSEILPGETLSFEAKLYSGPQAKELLEKTDLTVSEICYKVGFSSPSYFTKCFKNHFGIIPKEIGLQK